MYQAGNNQARPAAKSSERWVSARSRLEQASKPRAAGPTRTEPKAAS